MANIMTHLGKRARPPVLAGDVLKTAAACWLCWQPPELRLTALLYGGFGAVLGHNRPFRNHGHGGKGVAVTVHGLILPARHRGAVLPCGRHWVMLTGYLPLGAVLIAALAVPVGWLQYGGEAGALLLLSAGIMLAGIGRALRGCTEARSRSFSPRSTDTMIPPPVSNCNAGEKTAKKSIFCKCREESGNKCKNFQKKC